MAEMGNVHTEREKEREVETERERGGRVTAMPPMPTGMPLRRILRADETIQDTGEKQETASRAKLGKLHLSDTLSAIRHASTRGGGGGVPR
jgi:hypothetical protein